MSWFFSITAKELVADFIKFKTNEAKSHLITEGRVSTITTSLNKWFLQFVGENTKLEKLIGTILKNITYGVGKRHLT